jgi:hypothetical protein
VGTKKGFLLSDLMAKAGDYRERAVVAAAAEKEDCGGKRTKVWGDVQFYLFLSSVGVSG